LFVEAVEFPVFFVECLAEELIVVGVGVHRIAQQGVGLGIEGFEPLDFLHGLGLVDFSHAFCDTHGMIRDALKTGADFHGGDDQAQVRGDWMESDQDFHADLIDFSFEFIHVGVGGDDRVGKVGIAAQQGLHCLLEVLAGEGGHCQEVLLEMVDCVVVIAEEVLGHGWVLLVVGRETEYFKTEDRRRRVGWLEVM